MTDKKEISAVKPQDFQEADHRFRRFDCTVDANVEKEDLENPAMWQLIAKNLSPFDEIRAVSEDQTFVVYLVVLFVRGTDVRVKVSHGVQLEECDEEREAKSLYDVKLAGRLKYVLYNTKTGEHIKEKIPGKAEAYRELDDYEKAMAR